MPEPRKPLSKPVAFVLRAFITVCALGVSLWTLLNFVPGLAILPVAAKAKASPYCDTWKAVGDSDVKVQQAAAVEAILAKTRAVRTDGKYKLWATPSGDWWVPDTSDRIIGILLAQQERKIYGDASNGGVKKGDIVLDCGAHVGTYVKTALDAGAEKVVAIEPSPDAVECLRRNFKKELAEGRVILYAKGVWDEEKELEFFSNGNGAAGDSFLEGGPAAKKIGSIAVTTIDRIARELKLPRVDLIKADVKGAGTRMVLGARETITQYHPRVIVSTEEAPEDPKSIHDALMAISPAYKFRGGPCLFTGDEIRSDTIFFQ